jgi:preprotein translocase subunit Sec61beta
MARGRWKKFGGVTTGAGIFDAMDTTGGKIRLKPETVVFIIVLIIIMAYTFNTLMLILK